MYLVSCHTKPGGTINMTSSWWYTELWWCHNFNFRVDLQIYWLSTIISIGSMAIQINVREYRRDNQKWPIQRNWQQDEENKNKNMCSDCYYYSVWRRLNILCIMFHIIAFFIITVRCEGWHYTRISKGRAWPHQFTKKGGLDPWYRFYLFLRL